MGFRAGAIPFARNANPLQAAFDRDVAFKMHTEMGLQGRASTVKLAVSLHCLVPHVIAIAELPEFAAEVESWEADQVVIGDMLLTQETMEHPSGGAFDTTEPFLEPLAALAAVAVKTRRVRLSTGIVVASAREPVLLAKSAATVDVLSGGRLDLVVAAGWFRPIFDAVGVPMSDRVARLDAGSAAMRALWGEPPSSYSGEWSSFEAVHQEPRPLAGAAMPLWLGTAASSARAAQRVARLYDGWSFNSKAEAATVRTAMDQLALACDEVERDRREIMVRASLAAPDRPLGVGDSPSLDFCIRSAVQSARNMAELGLDYGLLTVGRFARNRKEAEESIRAVSGAMKDL
jgi:probable F420-dependent oxidoreductase